MVEQADNLAPQDQSLDDARAEAELLIRLANNQVARCEKLMKDMREFGLYMALGILLVGLNFGVLIAKAWWGLE